MRTTKAVICGLALTLIASAPALAAPDLTAISKTPMLRVKCHIFEEIGATKYVADAELIILANDAPGNAVLGYSLPVVVQTTDKIPTAYVDVLTSLTAQVKKVDDKRFDISYKVTRNIPQTTLKGEKVTPFVVDKVEVQGTDTFEGRQKINIYEFRDPSTNRAITIDLSMIPARL